MDKIDKIGTAALAALALGLAGCAAAGQNPLADPVVAQALKDEAATSAAVDGEILLRGACPRTPIALVAMQAGRALFDTTIGIRLPLEQLRRVGAARAETDRVCFPAAAAPAAPSS